MTTETQNRTWISWSALWRYSTAQIVIFGSLAAMLIPIVAQTVLFVSAMLTTSSQTRLEVAVGGEPWRVFAIELYISGLLLVVGKFLTQVCCPDRIRRFPFEDDHFVFIGNISASKTQLDANSGKISQGSEETQYSARVAKLLEQEESSAERTNTAWRESDLSLPVLRCGIALLFIAGSLGTMAFLAWSAYKNIGVIFSFAGA